METCVSSANTKVPQTSNTENDLRPISLTSVISKLFERVVLNLISPTWRRIMHTDQYAYRPLSSTTCALTAIQHCWLSTLDANPRCYIKVFAIDFSKAFDSVEHSLLVSKLLSYGFDQWFVAWFFSFLFGRTQRVRLHNSMSPFLPITRGIPQGTVLGPLAFVVFTNDLRPIDEKKMSVVKYADDQTWSYIIKHNDLDRSDTELASIAQWCTTNNMVINKRKTCEMVISNERTPTTLAPSFINNIQLERVDSVKILGLTLSSDLKWTSEIEYRVNKCRKLTYAMRHLSFTHSTSDMNYLFHSVFVPTLFYCCPAFCNMSISLVKKLQLTCNRASHFAGSHLDVSKHIMKCTFQLCEKSLELDHPLHPIVAKHLHTSRNRRILRRRRLLSVRSNTTRFLNSFLPVSIRIFNDNL